MRRRSYIGFLRAMVARGHEELKRPVSWDDAVRIAHREGISVRVVPLSRPAQLLRIGQRVFAQVSDRIPHEQRARELVHELTHFWRDDPGVACYHSEEEWVESEQEDFANIFAWLVTSPHRDIPGTREQEL
jgi:hypothetical protein